MQYKIVMFDDHEPRMDGGVVGCLKLLLLEILTYYLLCHMCSMQAKHDAMMKLLSPTVIVQTHANSPTTHANRHCTDLGS